MHFFRSLVMGIVLTALVQLALEAQNVGSEYTQAAPDRASVAGLHSTVDSSKSSTALRQNPDDDSSFGEDPDNRLMVPFVKHLASDQRAFWMAPVHFRTNDLKWIAPFAGITASFIASDSWTSKQIPLGRIERSKTISNYGLYSLIAAGGGAFVLGHVTGDDHMSEAGLLSGEAAMNSTAITYLLKSAMQRPRPYQTNGTGTFFQGGSSFPSEHAAIAWSIASVMAHEYPGTLSKVLAYGLATGISATRVTSQQHFASDVIIGSALGWYFGRQVYRAHHDAHLGGAPWGDLLPESVGNKERNPENMGSSYVPLDSWIYPALERLIALGYIKTGYLGIRPWTRLECARMLEEAEQSRADQEDPSAIAARIYRDLEGELSSERGRLNGAANLGSNLDSIYVRATSISGPTLRDGYHFGQTIINDYGRPYGEGLNTIAGVATHAEAGPFAFYLRGEYQQSSSVTPYTPAQLQLIASTDIRSLGSGFVPPGFFIDPGASHHFRLLEGEVSLTVRNLKFSFGRQSNWMGTGDFGALLMSDNAAPIDMLKIDNTSPIQIPFLSRLVGPARAEFFLGRLSGADWIYQPPILYGPEIDRQPFLHGTKISFHPTANLEFGMGFTAMFAGPGLPFTWHNFLRTFYSHKSNLADNPGKRFSAFDFAYRVPGLRNYLTVYLDSLVVDEYSPIGSSRPSLNPGLYLSQVPGLSKMDLRVEGFKTDHPLGTCCFPGSVYWDLRYNSGYTNSGNLIGSWIGRAGYGGQALTTYSISARTKIQLGYRHQEVDRAFIGGGRVVDYSARGDVNLGEQFVFSGVVQREQWDFPALSPIARSNTTVGLQLEFHPNLRVGKGQ
jgi:capsule assembly protein Wzi/PAP2 superfamily protein